MPTVDSLVFNGKSMTTVHKEEKKNKRQSKWKCCSFDIHTPRPNVAVAVVNEVSQKRRMGEVLFSCLPACSAWDKRKS